MDHEDALEVSEDVVASEKLLENAIGGWHGILRSEEHTSELQSH